VIQSHQTIEGPTKQGIDFKSRELFRVTVGGSVGPGAAGVRVTEPGRVPWLDAGRFCHWLWHGGTWSFACPPAWALRLADAGKRCRFRRCFFSRRCVFPDGRARPRLLRTKNALKKSVTQSVKGKQDDEPSIFQPSDERFNENIS